MEPGDLVLVTSLPKYWGAEDLRGSAGLLLGPATVSLHEASGNNFVSVLINGKIWTISKTCLAVISEAG